MLRARIHVLLLAALVTFNAPLIARDVKVISSGVSVWKDNPKDPGSISWEKVIQLLNQDLADAKQLNIYADLCHAGQLIDLQGDAKTKLTMPFVAGASCQIDQKSGDGASDFDKPWGRLPKRTTNDTIVNGRFYMSYLAYLTKGLRAAALPNVKAMHDDAVTNIGKENAAQADLLPGTPQYVAGNGADETLTVKSGDNQHDMVFAGDLEDLSYEMPRQTFLALQNLNPKSLQYYAHNLGNKVVDKTKIDGNGTAANLMSALASIKTSLAANKNKDEVNLFFKGHGSQVTKNVTPKDGAVPNMPKQGEEIEPPPVPEPPPIMFNVDMTSSIWNDLKQGVVANDPTLARAYAPEFYVSISEGTTPLPFNVSIDGISLGSMSFDSSITGDSGAYLAVPLSDSVLTSLIAANDGAAELQIGFSLPPGDSFRLALDDDMLYNPLFTPLEVGTGIIDYVSAGALAPGEVPEPASFSLAAAALLMLSRRKRSSDN